MITIDLESKQRIKSPIDIDNMGERYKTESEVFTFTSPSLWTLEKHLFFLLKDSIEKTFEPKYRMKPDYLSYDEYGTVILSYLLMFVNGVYSLEDFDLDNVIIPSYDSIVEICKDKFPKKDPNELDIVTW
jgi:hypothetical protein